MPAINSVSLDMTTQCDRRCPDCCAGIGINRTLQHHPWEYFEQAAKVLYGIPRLHLCGGEPTFHPQFAEFVPRFKKLFGCQRISMVTDGWGVVKHSSVIAEHVSEVHFTRYGNKPGAEAALRHMEVSCGLELRIFDAGTNMVNFTPRSRVGPGGPCHRAWWLSGGIAYADGKVYGCCVAPGIADSLPVMAWPGTTSALVDNLRATPLPCERCFFSE